MKDKLPFPLLDTPAALASCNGWTEEVYRDLLALQEGSISHDTLDAKYLYRRAILTLDLTGFTVQAMKDRPLNALLRILDAQKVCIPVLHEHGALLVRAFVDDPGRSVHGSTDRTQSPTQPFRPMSAGAQTMRAGRRIMRAVATIH